jgi:hypothetical protein
MKASPLLAGLSLLVLSGITPLLRGAEEKIPDAPVADQDNDFKLLASESIGKVRHDQKAEDLIKAYGEPKSKGEPEMWDAIGEWVQEWNYPDLGIVVKMSSEKKDGPPKVLIAIAGEACKLSSARKIKIGSTRAEVEKAYGDVQEKVPGDGPVKAGDPEAEPEEGAEGENSFVAGSVYGGLIFTFKDGKVVEMFLGAAAE